MDYLDLPSYNTTNYPLAVKEQLTNIPYSEDDSQKLKYHQFIVKNFFTRAKSQRGLLLAHSMGTGKTKIAVVIADHFRKYDSDRNVIVLLPKSLEGNFKNNIKEYTQQTDEYIDENYKFISLNASNMFKQVENLQKTDEEISYEKQLGSFMEDIKQANTLDNSLLIIDEAHNLFNAITNGAKNATALYDMIMNSVNIKILFLTGTPIINDPFELVPCFNMLRGRIVVDQVISNSKHTSKHKDMKKHEDVTLFSETYEEFEDYFINYENKTIKNKDKFTNRIYGLTSYYGDLYFSSKREKQGFPKRLPPIIEHVHMSLVQYSRYAIARLSEQEETKRSFAVKGQRFSSSSGSTSTYRVKSRQISNYCIPEYALGPINGNKSREKFIDKITETDLQNLEMFSPKMAKVLENINKNPTQLALIYSQFVSGEGLGIFARVLNAHGYVNFNDELKLDNSAVESDLNTNGDEYDIKPRLETNVDKIKSINQPKPKAIDQPKRYAILSGDITPDKRLEIIKTFNSKDNADGSHIHLLLLSGAVAEGIDLKRVRNVHIIEPFWNYARLNQVVTRAVRYLSHEDLSASEQTVQTYIYLSTYPRNHPKNKITESTTDVDLYNKSLTNMKIIDSFMLTLAESSIDCGLHYTNLSDDVKENIHCKLCAPTNEILYHPLLSKDMNLPNTCHPYHEKKIKTYEIILDETGERFYYIKSDDMSNDKQLRKIHDYTIYYYNKKIQGYMKMPRSHPNYSLIMEKLIAMEV